MGLSEPTLKPPSRTATTLRLVASFPSCLGGDDRLENLSVEQNRQSIEIDVEARVYATTFCESRRGRIPFTVRLDGQLGERIIIDASHPTARVIWSARLASGYRRAARLTPGDAEEFVVQRLPEAVSARCERLCPHRFGCSYARGNGKEGFTYIGARGDGSLVIGG